MEKEASSIKARHIQNPETLQPLNNIGDFPITFVDGAGSLHVINNSIRFGLLQDHVDRNGEFHRKIVARLAMTPETAESIAKWLLLALDDLKRVQMPGGGSEA